MLHYRKWIITTWGWHLKPIKELAKACVSLLTWQYLHGANGESYQLIASAIAAAELYSSESLAPLDIPAFLGFLFRFAAPIDPSTGHDSWSYSLSFRHRSRHLLQPAEMLLKGEMLSGAEHLNSFQREEQWHFTSAWYSGMVLLVLCVGWLGYEVFIVLVEMCRTAYQTVWCVRQEATPTWWKWVSTERLKAKVPLRGRKGTKDEAKVQRV